ncbi:MAG: hypothetical protein RL367_213 [Pseudomonadota bacterium]
MFETLFTYPKILARHFDAPAFAERKRYLAHCAYEGMAHATLIGRARDLLVVAEYLDVTAGKSFSQRDIETTAEKWLEHLRRRGQIDKGHWSRRRFIQVATSWLGFIGRLALRDSAASVFQGQIDDFLACLGTDHGLAQPTISGRRWQVDTFLRSLASSKVSIRSITVRDVDDYLDGKGREGWCRVSVATCATALRSFFRHAEMRGWCVGGIASAIDSPRLYKQEGLPQGPHWDDVLKLMAASNRDNHRDIRDHAILMLLAIYGLRSGEVRNLRLDDLDWTREVITIKRSKQRCIQTYPLVASVGNAIVRYLQRVRPQGHGRQLFLTLRAPISALSPGCMYHIVNSRLDALGIQAAHHGPHALRHACATHLVAEGLSLKEIGDHLGHRSASATRTYAKVDLGGLREVAAFDLEGLS